MSINDITKRYEKNIKEVVEYLSFDMKDVEIVSVLEYRGLTQNEIRLCMFAGQREYKESIK